MNNFSISGTLGSGSLIAPSESGRIEARQNIAQQASDTARVQTQQAVQQTEQGKPPREEVEKAVKEVNDFLKPLNNSLEFGIDDDTGTTVVKVVDTSTQDVIRQIPSEEMLSIAKAIDTMKGLLVQQKA